MTPDQNNPASQATQPSTQTDGVALDFNLQLDDAQPVVQKTAEVIESTPLEKTSETPVIQLDLPTTQSKPVEDTSRLQDTQSVAQTPSTPKPEEVVSIAQEVKKEETPIIEKEVATQEQSLDFLKEKTPTEQTPTEQTPTEQIPTEQTPTEQTPTEQTPTEQIPTEQTPTEQIPTEQTPTEQTPTEQTYAPTDTAFQATVDALKQQEGKQGQVSLQPTQPAAQVAQEPFGGGVNLDDVLKNFAQPATPAPVEVAPVVNTPAPVVNPFQAQDMAQSPYAVVTPQPAPVQPSVVAEPVHKHSGSGIKILLSFVLLILGGFVLKTMYPVEFNSLLAGILGTPTETNEEVVVLTGTLTLSGEDTLALTGTEMILTGELAATGTLDDTQLIVDTTLSGDHSASTGFDPFIDLNTLGEDQPILQDPTTSLIMQLREYALKGEEYLALGKKNNDQTLTKYGLYISKKATTLATSLENGEEIDTQVLDTYLASFSGYLEKLYNLVNAEPQAIIPEPQQDISSGEIPTDDMSSGSQEIPVILQ